MSPVKHNFSDAAIALGRALAIARRDARLSQAEVGRRLGVSRITVSNWETGKHAPDEETLGRIGRIYGRTTAQLRYGIGWDQPDVGPETVVADVLASEAMRDADRLVRVWIEKRLPEIAHYPGGTSEELPVVASFLNAPEVLIFFGGPELRDAVAEYPRMSREDFYRLLYKSLQRATRAVERELAGRDAERRFAAITSDRSSED